MGVCNEERPVMHWQQSARFFGPSGLREQSPTLPATTGLGGLECATRGTTGMLMRPCATCPDVCDHGPKGYHPLGSGNINNNNNYPDYCRGYRTPDRLMYDENVSPQSANNLLHLHNHHHHSTNNNNNSHPHGLHPPPQNSLEGSNYVELTGKGGDCGGVVERTSLNCSGSGGGGGNSVSGNSNNDSGVSNDYNLQLKSEPIGGPGTPDSLAELGGNSDDCAGCGQLIQDRFYLSAVEKRWHAGCLQCCMCRQLLEGETSCYARDENIYCKTDYYRLFGNRRCARCLATISSSEMVMRARHLVFHVRCFSCAICNTVLTKGDQCGMRDSTIYCRLHYDITLETESMANQSKTMTMSCQQPQPFGSSPLGSMSPGGSSIIGGAGGGGGGGGGGPVGLGPDGKLSAGYYGGSQHSLPGLTQPPRQKGRPRKRKPKDLEAMTANLDLSTEYLDLSYGRGGHGLSASSRTKRMRTSFKHHQLRTMKSYFAINHNPDAKDLKQLSQKTGLPKRVLQVWFQNARAKWRRMMMKQEGKSGGPESEKGDMSLDLDSYSDHSPSFMMSGPHSPHSMD